LPRLLLPSPWRLLLQLLLRALLLLLQLLRLPHYQHSGV
jgi:hypothetical protein